MDEKPKQLRELLAETMDSTSRAAAIMYIHDSLQLIKQATDLLVAAAKNLSPGDQTPPQKPPANQTPPRNSEGEGGAN